MASERVLVIEDDEDIQELVQFNLEKDGFKVICRSTGESGLKAIEKQAPDIVVLDLMLPGLDGLAVCRKLRDGSATQDLPIIMVTAKGTESDIVAGLEIGADDYITKPFSPRVLAARIRTVLRRGSEAAPAVSDDVLKRGPIEIDNLHHEVRVDGTRMDLTLTEFRVLELLAKRPGVVFTRYQIVDAVKGEDYPVTDRSVDVQVVGLRRKLDSYSHLIETVRGVGYRFAAKE